MKRPVVLATVLATAALLAGPPVAGAHERQRTRVVDVLVQSSRVTFVDLNGNGLDDVGDARMGTLDVFRRGTRRRIGTVSFTSLIVSTGFELFSAALRLRGGDLFVEGVTSADEEDEFVFDAIVGGTRAFRGARGQARERIVEESDDTSASEVLIRVRLTFSTPARRRR